jgi:cysteinyl-tRNA synthetase
VVRRAPHLPADTLIGVALHLYDTATRRVRPFEPLVPGQAGIYLCGATVQAPPHLGHVRSGIAFDVLRRWLEACGYAVTFVRNVTDIDDKILAKSAEQGIPWWQWAFTNERAFTAAYEVLGCEPPTYEPRATGHVPEMIELMHTLLAAGHAYVAGDAAPGDVYFDVRSWPRYGELTRQRLDDMAPAQDSELAVGAGGKRDARDFALWKGSKPDEPASASWLTPWGRGRPGWHLECTAMAGKYLGYTFDIHGGGLDLRFPHHENELAQAAAAGRGFARYWMHNGMLNTAGEKMSKSLGNSLLVTQVVQRARPIEVRYYLLSAHYRSVQEFSEGALLEAGAAWRRVEGFLERAMAVAGPVPPADVPPAFAAAMDDDLGTPGALAVLHGEVREGLQQLAAGEADRLRARVAAVRGMLDVLGLDPSAAVWAGGSRAGDARLGAVVDTLVEHLLAERAQARARRDFATADAVRERLLAAGVVVEDTPHGARWTLASDLAASIVSPTATPTDKEQH